MRKQRSTLHLIEPTQKPVKTMSIQALIFDVFGTCVDWRTGVAKVAEAEFKHRDISVNANEFATYWRSRYVPAMARIRTGQRGYIALDELHYENLLESLEHFGLAHQFSETESRRFARAWEQLPPWPDVIEGLTELRKYVLIAPCSNGSIALMSHLARFANIRWDAILGADIAKNYKPEPAVYQACVSAFQLEPENVMMVAAHNDDLHAARASGLKTAFVARPMEHGPGQSTDLAPESDWDIVAVNFNDLVEKLKYRL